MLAILLLVPLLIGTGAVPAATARVPAKGVSASRAVTVLRGDVRWAGHQTHRLSGTTILSAGSSLTIGAGAVVLADSGAELIVPRESRLNANGTFLEPIVFTCSDPAPTAGCWNGLTIAGNGVINHGPSTSPPVRGSGAAGCRESSDRGVAYGGCAIRDSSGVLRYARIEYAVRGLELLAVGAATRIEYVQVHRSLGNGVTIVGSNVGLRFLALTTNAQFGLAWTGGWTGYAQHLIVQGDPSLVAGGMQGRNGGRGGSGDDATPRSAPSVANVTIVLESNGANPYGSTPPRALVLERGTAGDVRDVLLFRPAVALDVDGASTCAQVGANGLRLRGVVTVAATSLGPPGSPPSTCGPYGTPDPESEWLARADQQNVVVSDPVEVARTLIAGTDVVLPDLRPPFNSPAATLSVVGGGGAEFDVTTWRGGVKPADAGRANAPWYSGWTVGEVLVAPALASLSGQVFSAIRGALVGVRVTLEPSQRQATSASSGAYALTGVPPGPSVLSVSSVPAGCVIPASESFVLPAGAAVTRDIGVPCRPAIESSLDAGARHTCALTEIGEAWCWGSNDRGQLGIGGASESRVPAQVLGMGTYQVIAASDAHTCGLTSARVVRCWGANTQGQLGLLDTLDRPLPTPIASAVGFTAVAAGANHNCALSITGRAYCWGRNDAGQLGIGNTIRTLGPAEASGGLAFVGITAGGVHSCAWTATGEAYCWGSNVFGGLGIPTVTQALVPTQVATGLRFTSLTAGESHTCGITTGNQAYCWGGNQTGQLGTGSAVGESQPRVVASNPLTTSLATAAELSSFLHTCAVTGSGGGLCWGYNSTFQLGTETSTTCAVFGFDLSCSRVPLSVDGGLAFTRIVAGRAHSCGFTTARTLYCWGENSAGQLGDGGSGTSILPVLVAGLLAYP